MKKTMIALLALSMLFMVGCETTTGYRKSAGGVYAHHSLKNVTVHGNLVFGEQKESGTNEQTGTAAGAASGNEVKADAEVKDSLNGNTVDGVTP